MGTNDDDDYFTEELNRAIDQARKEAGMTPEQRKQAKAAEDKERTERERELERQEAIRRQQRENEYRRLQAQMAEEDRREAEEFRKAQELTRKEELRRQADEKRRLEHYKDINKLVERTAQKFIQIEERSRNNQDQVPEDNRDKARRIEVQVQRTGKESLGTGSRVRGTGTQGQEAELQARGTEDIKRSEDNKRQDNGPNNNKKGKPKYGNKV